MILEITFLSVHFSSVSHSFPTLCSPMYRSTPSLLSITNSQSSPKLMCIESVMPSSHLILCLPFLPPPSVFPSIRVFSNESALPIKWPRDCSFSFSIGPSSEYSGLISFRMDWLAVLAFQGTLKSLQGLVYHKGLTVSQNLWNSVLERKNRTECWAQVVVRVRVVHPCDLRAVSALRRIRERVVLYISRPKKGPPSE